MYLRRHPDTHVLKTYLAHGPADLPLDTLVWLKGMRWPIETCFQEGKQLLGLGDYEGRSGTGWHYHMTLCLLAHFFPVRRKKAPTLTVPQMCLRLALILPCPRDDVDPVLAVLDYRALTNTAAAPSHTRRRIRRDPD